MSDPTGWQVPKGYGQGGDPAQYGLAAPPGYEPVYLVPRPPRPGVVNIAVMLTYVGVLLGGLQVLAGALVSWEERRSLSGLTGTGLSGNGSLSESQLQTTIMIGIIISVVVNWLVPGAGAVVTAVLTARGANAARIVLASLMGLFALVNLCQVTGGAAVIGLGTRLVPGALVPAGWVWADLLLSLVKFALAVTIGVLLLVPPANRYFSPGPGRRFVNGMTQVPSTYDRP
jgi:hypothetical protein